MVFCKESAILWHSPKLSSFPTPKLPKHLLSRESWSSCSQHSSDPCSPNDIQAKTRGRKGNCLLSTPVALLHSSGQTHRVWHALGNTTYFQINCCDASFYPSQHNLRHATAAEPWDLPPWPILPIQEMATKPTQKPEDTNKTPLQRQGNQTNLIFHSYRTNIANMRQQKPGTITSSPPSTAPAQLFKKLRCRHVPWGQEGGLEGRSKPDATLQHAGLMSECTPQLGAIWADFSILPSPGELQHPNTKQKGPLRHLKSPWGGWPHLLEMVLHQITCPTPKRKQHSSHYLHWLFIPVCGLLGSWMLSAFPWREMVQVPSAVKWPHGF